MRDARASRPFQTLRHWLRLATDAGYRATDREHARIFDEFCTVDGGAGYRADVRPAGGYQKTALIASQSYLPFSKIEALMIKGLQMAGFRTVVMGNRGIEYMRYGWLAGNDRVVETRDFATPGEDYTWVAAQMPRLNDLNTWLDLQ